MNTGSKSDWAYNNRGFAYASKGDYDTAITNYNKALEFDPNDAWTYFQLGFAYSNKGNYDQAIADYTKAVELNPNNEIANNNLQNLQNYLR